MLDLSHVNALITPLPPIQTPRKIQTPGKGPGPRRVSPVGPSAQHVPHTPQPLAAQPFQATPVKGPSPRARRVGYTVDLASQKLYMASLNKNRFRASLSFQEFEAGLQEALHEHAQMAEAKFETMKMEQEEKDRQLEVALARLGRAEETIAMLTERLSDSEAKQADVVAATQAQVAAYAQQMGEMAGMVARLRERLKVDAVARGHQALDAHADQGAPSVAPGAADEGAPSIFAGVADASRDASKGTGAGAATGGADVDTIEQQLATHQKANLEAAAQVMHAAGKLDSLIAHVHNVADKLSGREEDDTQTSAAHVGELAKKIDSLSHSSLLEGRGIRTPSTQQQPDRTMASPQRRLQRAGNRLSELSALVTQLEGEVRENEPDAAHAEPVPVRVPSPETNTLTAGMMGTRSAPPTSHVDLVATRSIDQLEYGRRTAIKTTMTRSSDGMMGTQTVVDLDAGILAAAGGLHKSPRLSDGDSSPFAPSPTSTPGSVDAGTGALG